MAKDTSIGFVEEDRNGEFMFIRFVSSEIDEDSHVSAGLFCAASQLSWTDGLPQYEFDAITELRDWFDTHLESPIRHLPRTCRYELAVCWFKPTAREHLLHPCHPLAQLLLLDRINVRRMPVKLHAI